MTKAWVNRWTVIGTSGKEYTVAQKPDGSFGCSCPSWKFQRADETGKRRDCQHILSKRLELQAVATPASPAPNHAHVFVEVSGRKLREE